MIGIFKERLKEHGAFIVFLLVTMILMAAGIIWVYHVKVLNAPKVYSDGFGYFVYLPAILYGDFQFDFVRDFEHPLTLIQADGGLLNKYPVGVAIMESPFFFTAHVLSLLRDALTGSFTATGYSNWYQYLVLFGGVVYYGIGTILLYCLLIQYLNISRKIACITCILITYGTNLFHYASYDAGFSHIYSYVLLIMFLYYLCWYEERDKVNKNNILLTCVFGILAGMIFLIRNVNIFFVVTYIFYGVKDLSSLKKRFITVLQPGRVLPIILAGVASIMPQLFYWHSATGHWILYSYGSNEPFYWLHPELINFLFSVRKGLFFWNPILIVPVIGIIYAYKNRNELYTGMVLFLIIIIYISGSWWCWYYGGSYGQRVAVDFMCIFAVFLATLLNGLHVRQIEMVGTNNVLRIIQIAVYGYCCICVIWNCICTLAYWQHIIPTDETTWQHIAAIMEWL